MKTTRRKFTSKFKAQVAIEAIKERESMTDLAKRFEVHPAQITTWKREFLERADLAFGGQSDAPKLTALEAERDDLYRKVGELEMQRDFLKKISNLTLMGLIDRLFLDDPTLGVKGMRDELRDQGFEYNDKRIRRLMRKMCLMPIYNKRNLSRLGLAKYIHPLRCGFLYLTAIIDVYSRFVVGWQLSNSLDKETQTTLLRDAVGRYGKPEIINSDQGSQYTCEHWVSTLKELGIQISMDGKGRATDNAYIERFWGTLKRKYVYLHPADDGLVLYDGIKTFIEKYNNRFHQGINREKPINLYLKAA